jgi:probable rRNA maturation factor
LGFPDAELSITLVDDPTIASLAGDYGRTRKPTDVLAFSMLEGIGAEHRGEALGDVVISLDTAKRQADERNVSLDQEVRDLTIHGILHLLGMDHEDPTDALGMKALEDHLRWELDRV